jgi:hypothetical protein
MQQNKQDPWYKQIRAELGKRDEACGIKFGSSYEYIRPPVDPYMYHDVHSFKKANPFKATPQYCHVMPSKVGSAQDPSERFYTKPRHKKQCANLRGVWKSRDINRLNKYDHGVCWTDVDDAHCSAEYVDPQVLRPKNVRAGTDALAASIQKNSQLCNADPKCHWVKTGRYSYDCFSRKRSQKQHGKIETPPDHMPVEDGLENYIYEWYKNNRPSRAPTTNELIGVGNRCVATTSTQEISSKNDYNNIRKNLINFDPLSKDYQWYYERYLGEQDIRTLRREYRFGIETHKQQKKRLLNADELNKLKETILDTILDETRVEHIKNVLDEQELVQEDVGHAPSIPQSVINMMMKNISRQKASQRGMLAWHSTGSGKCHARNTPILMFDGNIKRVQDIQVGDLVMGDDSKERLVLDLGRGFDVLYTIIDHLNNESYVVNSEHILCLKDELENIIEIEVNDYISLPIEYKRKLKGYRVPVEFPPKPCPVDPYQAGFNLDVVKASCIPGCYKVNESNVRMQYLAGFLDRNAKLDIVTFAINIANKPLAQDVKYLARSLGLCACLHNNEMCIKGGFVPCQKLKLPYNAPKLSGVYDISVHMGRTDWYYGFMLNSNQRYLMGDFTVTHNTCTAAGVIDSFWDDSKDIIFASSLDALASNPDYKFHECALNLYPRFQRDPFIGLANISQAFKKRNVRFMSFAQLSYRVQATQKYKTSGNPKDKPVGKMFVDLDNTVLIFDEVHNLFRPLQTQKRLHEYLEAQLVDPTIFPNLKIVILTATPGDNIPDVIKLLNIIRDPKKPPITAPSTNSEQALDAFKKSIRNMISFFDMSTDLTKFPKLLDEFPVKVPIGKRQFEAYVDAYNGVTPHARNFESLAKDNQTYKYWAAARRYANMLYNFEPNLTLAEFSHKLPYLIENIKRAPTEKHYVYSAFFENRGYGGHGVIAIAKELEKIGYEKLTVHEAKKNKSPDKRPRFILAITNEIAPDNSDSTAGKNLHEMIRVFNNPENKNGEFVHVFLASQGFNEGIDLKAVRNIHIFEPLVTWASDKQTLGRAVRYCSHADLDRDKGEWVVKVFRYITDMPLQTYKDETIQQENRRQDIKAKIESEERHMLMLPKKAHQQEIRALKASITANKKELRGIEKALRADVGNIQNIEEVVSAEAKERMRTLLDIYQAMKEAAVDCRIMQEFHKSTCAPFAE